MSATLLLILGVLSCFATLVTLVRFRAPGPLGFVVMITGWLTGEYPLFHLAVQAVAVAGLIAVGALAGSVGILGLALAALSWAGLVAVGRLRWRAERSGEEALLEALGSDYRDRLTPGQRDVLRDRVDHYLVRHPLRHDDAGIDIARSIAYGRHPKRNTLDVFQPQHGTGSAPVILQIHGGAWMIGNKQEQGQPLLHQLARSGYVGVSINYRLAPKTRLPEQLIDVKRAIAWVRDNIAEYGGDPATIILTGGSAGGHLAALAALTAGDPRWQPGFEIDDTSVSACVAFYGPMDLLNRDGIRGRLTSMESFLRRFVMPRGSRDSNLWSDMSPRSHVGPNAPPFFVIQGQNDTLVFREESRAFVDDLRRVSHQPVAYWEVPGAQHAFDTFNSVRSALAVDAVQRFVGWVASHDRVAETTQGG